MTAGVAQPIVELVGATLGFGTRTLWSDLDLRIERGQFTAVLGANGAGKTSLLRVLLGQTALTSGSVRIAGAAVRRGSDLVGYIPQRVGMDPAVRISARDLVRTGVDGHRWGLPIAMGARRRTLRATVDGLLDSVGATAFADAPVSTLSGGELQRIRVAEALGGRPAVLICDEPLAALDIRHQEEVAELIDELRREHDTAIVFVTHEINPVLPFVDQVLYLAAGRFRLGPPAEVMTSATLSELYGAPVDVISAHGRLIVLAANDSAAGMHQSTDDHTAFSHDRFSGDRFSRDRFSRDRFSHDPFTHDHGHHDPLDQTGWQR